MPQHLNIEGQDRTFCELVAEAAFSNPFGDSRRELDRQIIGSATGTDEGDEERIARLTAAVAERVQKLELAGRADLRLYATADRFVMQVLFLFELYYRYYSAFDRLIVEQMDAGDASIRVPFSGEALALLRRRGFNPGEALRFFAVLFQLRRAHYFIARKLAGKSPCMKEFRRHLWSSVFTHDIRMYERYLWNRMEDFSTLLLGETGTGKGTAAAAMGRSAFIPFDARKECFEQSFNRSFVSINLSQYPESLVESELFGHRKGAFTGAIEDHEGVLARCSAYGAIFLDELGDVPAPVQIKLLQVLQERTFCPVGSHEKRRFRGRVIAATNQPLDELRERGLFRDDFFYRVSSDVVAVPTLRQRLREDPGELVVLVAHILPGMIGDAATELAAQISGKILDSVGADYSWPGNVRELEQAVRRVLLTDRYARGREKRTSSEAWLRDVSAGTLDAESLLSRYCAMLHARLGSYTEVARITNLDRRTVRLYVEKAGSAREGSGEKSG